jgi:hypothetical protein
VVGKTVGVLLCGRSVLLEKASLSIPRIYLFAVLEAGLARFLTALFKYSMAEV